MSELFNTLRIDELRDFTSNDPTDLQGDSILKVGEKYGEKMRQIPRLLPSIFDFRPLETPLGVSTELRGERWSLVRGSRYSFGQRLILQLLPFVSGFDPAREARQGYRSTFGRREAKSRGGTGGRHARATGTEDPKVVHVSFEGCLNVPARFDENSALLDAERIVNLAKKHMGPKSAVLFRSLAEGKGKTQKDAARAARVTDRTARNHLAKMRRLLTE
jgi:hypothetical protein